MQTLKNKTIFVTGGSRGIGKAIALRAARDGANIIIAAKSDKPHAITLKNTLDSSMPKFDPCAVKAGQPLLKDLFLD